MRSYVTHSVREPVELIELTNALRIAPQTELTLHFNEKTFEIASSDWNRIMSLAASILSQENHQ